MRFTKKDYGRLLDLATGEFTAMPARMRLPGMDKDMDTEQKRVLAIFKASLTMGRDQWEVENNLPDSETVNDV